MSRPRDLDRPARKVLMISYGFPPAGGSGVQRSAKFAKYLPDFGWEPIIWTCSPPGNLPRDDSLLADLPQTLARHIHSRLDTSRWAANAAGLARAMVRGIVRHDRWADGVSWRTQRAVDRMLELALIPDVGVLWGLSSLRGLANLIRQERVDVIWSTYSPATNHLLGYHLSRTFRLPWVADFRDLWTQDFRYPYANGPRWRRCIDRYCERRVLARADAVVGVTQGQADLLASICPQPRDKFVTITNGVDLADFDNTAATEHCSGVVRSDESQRGRQDRLVLAFVGRFRRATVPQSLFDGLRMFSAKLGIRRDDFELRIVGHMSQVMRSKLEGCGVRFSATGQVPHTQAIREMLAADMLLLTLPQAPHAETTMAGKVFEYLAAGRPILSVGPDECVVGKLVTSLQAGVTANCRAESICRVLSSIWQQFNEGHLPSGCAPDRLPPFTRRNLTGKLAALLESVCRGEDATPARCNGSLDRRSARRALQPV